MYVGLYTYSVGRWDAVWGECFISISLGSCCLRCALWSKV